MYRFLIFFLCSSFIARAQQNIPDTVGVLENVVIQAYETNRKLIDVSAAISLVFSQDLDRYDNTTMVEALNAKPGVRMDERSPGSYRINIRGSSLRSPFGVRNVKVYYNGIPFTDPGGLSYLNQLGFYSVRSMEIIKGPAGSIYGAGTGGVLLLNVNPKQFVPGASMHYNVGSYGLQNIHANAGWGNQESNNTISFQHQKSDGYRDNTAMRRDMVTWNALLKKTGTSTLNTHFLYGDLYYQTPGALTKAEYEADPSHARPETPASPSARDARAAFFAKTFLAGISLEQKINESWKNTTSLYGAYSQNRNPNFRNYSRTSEPHFGGRTSFQWNKTNGSTIFNLNAGAEFQQSFNTQRVYTNNGGEPGTLQTDDEIYNTQGFIFSQLNVEIKGGWLFSVGTSLNESIVAFERLSETAPQNEKRNFKNELAPRFSILKKLGPDLSVYGNVASGFSPPGASELLPSTDIFNLHLQAETGNNYEIGTRGSFLGHKLYFDINAYYYRLKNAIIQKRDATGGDYFDNAGSANQAGFETYLSYEFNDPAHFIKYGKIYGSSTINHFRYDKYLVTDKDYSGNEIPGVAPQTLAAGIDVNTLPGIYANFTFFVSGKIALNDANSDYADPYHLLGIKMGYKRKISNKNRLEIFGGIQNILNTRYSLGNDINAFGGRYYNAAPGRNFYTGLALRFDR